MSTSLRPSPSSSPSAKANECAHFILKILRGATGRLLSTYLYDGLTIVQEQGSGGSVIADHLTSLGIDEVFTRTDGGTTKTLLRDALGSTLAMADGSGIVTSWTYDPYGKATYTGVAQSNPFLYTGRELDGTDLYYYRARYYHPTLQRFIAEDPIGFAGGANVYGYVGGNPLNFTDAIGLSAWTFEAFIGGIGGSITVGTNPDGGSFTTVRFGAGIGGGLSYDANGKSPGYGSKGRTPCPWSSDLGLYGSGGAAIGPVSMGASGSAGIHSEGPSFYDDPVSGYRALDMSMKGLRGSISGGVEATFY